MSNEQTVQCSNPPCQCQITVLDDSDELYCSPRCKKDAEEEERDECRCAHPPCDSR